MPPLPTHLGSAITPAATTCGTACLLVHHRRAASLSLARSSGPLSELLLRTFTSGPHSGRCPPAAPASLPCAPSHTVLFCFFCVSVQYANGAVPLYLAAVFEFAPS